MSRGAIIIPESMSNIQRQQNQQILLLRLLQQQKPQASKVEMKECSEDSIIKTQEQTQTVSSRLRHRHRGRAREEAKKFKAQREGERSGIMPWSSSDKVMSVCVCSRVFECACALHAPNP
jgi:hypothetical protein